MTPPRRISSPPLLRRRCARCGHRSAPPARWGERGDLNPRPPGPQPGALTELSYAHHGAVRQSAMRFRLWSTQPSIGHGDRRGRSALRTVAGTRTITEGSDTHDHHRRLVGCGRRSPAPRASHLHHRARARRLHASAPRVRRRRPSEPARCSRWECRRASRPTTLIRSSSPTRPGRTWSTSTATATSTTTWASARCSPGTCTRPCGPRSRPSSTTARSTSRPPSRTPSSPSCSPSAIGLPLWRFTNSGTESTMDAVRVARGATGRDKIVKVEGGYHGHHDELLISMKPDLAAAGPADRPTPVPATAGITAGVLADTIVIPYNDPAALERVLAGGRRRRVHRRAGDGEHRHLPARRRLPRRPSGRSRRATARC